MKKHGKIENAFKRLCQRCCKHFISMVSFASYLQIVEGLWEIILYPLLIALPAFFYFGMLYVWMMAGVWAVLGYTVVVFVPIVIVLIKREKEYIKCLNRQ